MPPRKKTTKKKGTQAARKKTTKNKGTRTAARKKTAKKKPAKKSSRSSSTAARKKTAKKKPVRKSSKSASSRRQAASPSTPSTSAWAEKRLDKIKRAVAENKGLTATSAAFLASLAGVGVGGKRGARIADSKVVNKHIALNLWESQREPLRKAIQDLQIGYMSTDGKIMRASSDREAYNILKDHRRTVKITKDGKYSKKSADYTENITLPAFPTGDLPPEMSRVEYAKYEADRLRKYGKSFYKKGEQKVRKPEDVRTV